MAVSLKQRKLVSVTEKTTENHSSVFPNRAWKFLSIKGSCGQPQEKGGERHTRKSKNEEKKGVKTKSKKRREKQ